MVENCAFLLQPNSALTTQIYHQEGTRATVRHCNFVGSNGDPGFLECHGNQGGGMRGTVMFEVYSNSFRVTSYYRMAYFRGGTIFYFGNTYRTDSGNPPIALTEEESWQTAMFSPLRTSWPAQDQITNSFFWGNTVNGVTPSIVRWNANDATFIQQGRDYWMEAPNAANGRPAGVYANYRPLIYPHPMATAQDSGGGGNTNETVVSSLSITPSRVDFGSATVGTTNLLQLRFDNTGNTSLSGFISVAAPFSIVGSSTYSLSSGASQVFSVRFAPTQAGSFSQNLSISGGWSATVPVTGTATAPSAPNLAISPARLDYGTVMVGTTNLLQLRFDNTGSTSLSGSISVSAPFAVIGSSSYSLSSGGSQTFWIQFAPPQTGNHSQNLSITGGWNATVPVTGAAVQASDASSLLFFNASEGEITAPFTLNPNGTISQSVLTTTPANGGLATFTFRVLQAGNYTVSAYVYAPDDGANSAFINIDGEPTTAMVWSVPVSANPTNRMVTYAGNTSPQVWNLTAGVHQLVLRGREAGMQIQRFSLVAADSTLNPTSVGGVQFQANP